MDKLLKEKGKNYLRGLSFVFGVLSYLESDPVCRKCYSFDKSVEVAKDKFLALEKSINKNKGISGEMRKMLLGIYTVLGDLNIPDNPVDQKKAENCRFPKGVCLAKSALAIHKKIEG